VPRPNANVTVHLTLDQANALYKILHDARNVWLVPGILEAVEDAIDVAIESGLDDPPPGGPEDRANQ